MVAVKLARVRDRIVQAAFRAGREPLEVRLVAVSKDRTVEEILEAYRAGQRIFGENRAQELEEKAGRLPPDIEWHFVGPLQRNKVKLVRPRVSLLHSLDRARLARSWRKGPGMPPPVLVEVNVAGEDQKLGVPPERAGELVRAAVAADLEVRGLMTIPPRVDRPEQARPYFERLAALRQELQAEWPQIQELSMGMTEDFEVAVEAGSTYVRVGRAIFEPVDD